MNQSFTKQASGYFLLKYIRTFLCKKKADKDQENHFPHVPRFPYPQGISRKGARSLERVEGGGGGLELGSSHQLLSLPPHP